jgi:hypothetical protein
VSSEQNGRLVRGLDSGTAIWEFTHDEGHSFPLPVFSLAMQTRSMDGEVDIHQFFFTPQLFVSLMGEVTNHMWRLWGSDTTPLTSADALDDFLSKMMENTGQSNDDDDDDGYTPGGYA